MLIALLKKDLEQHRKGLFIYAVSVILVPLVLADLSHATSESGFLGSVVGYIGFGGPMLMALWFVGQEKMKGTLRILRALPISGRQIVVTKMITSSLVCLGLANVVLLGEPSLLSHVLLQPLHITAPIILALNGLLWFACCFYTAIFVVLEQKIAIQVSYWGIFALVLAGLMADKISKARHINFSFMTKLPAIILIVVVLALASLVALEVASRVLEWKEWSELEEE